MKLDATRIDLITFNTVTLGSVVVNGTVTTPDGSASSISAASTALSTALSARPAIAGFTVTSSSVVTNYNQEESKLGLILGLAIGIPIAIGTPILT